MNIGSIVALIVFIVLLIIFLVWVFRKDKEISGYRAADGDEYTPDSPLETGDGSNLAFSIWIYVSEWSTDSKNVYTIGHSSKSDQLVVKLGTNYPELTVSTSTYDSTSSAAAAGPFEDITINNFPLQTWVCVAVSIYNSSMDIYINGKLVKTQVSDGSYLELEGPSDADTTVPIALFEGGNGFIGYINKFKYWNKALTPQDAWNVYKSGPGGTIFGNLISGRSVNINLMNGNDVTSSFTI
jgi:hypothetical protein